MIAYQTAWQARCYARLVVRLGHILDQESTGYAQKDPKTPEP